MGRYSVPLAPQFAAFARIQEHMRAVDVGAGTGALTSELVRLGAEVAAAEPDEAFVDALRRRFPSADVQVAVAEALPWANGSFDAAVSQLVVAFMRDARAGVLEMRRVVRRGGVVALCMWDRDGMQMLGALQRAREALGALDPATEAGMRHRTREELEALFDDGFEHKTTELLVVDAGYADFADFWDALRGGANQSGRWADSLTGSALQDAQAAVFRELGAPSGAFTLRAEAWAVAGRT